MKQDGKFTIGFALAIASKKDLGESSNPLSVKNSFCYSKHKKYLNKYYINKFEKGVLC